MSDAPNGSGDERGSARRAGARFALHAALTYAALGAVWIVVSDSVVDMLVEDRARGRWFQTSKGWAFVLASALVLYVFIRRYAGDQARALQALREGEARYRSLFENVLDGVAYCRMIYEGGEPTDFEYLDVNRKFEELTGLRDVVGKRVSEVIPGIRRSHPELFDTYDRVARTGAAERFEIYLEGIGWLSVGAFSQEQGHFVAVFENITERKRSQEELRRSEERFRAIADNAGDLIYRYRLVEPRGFEYVSRSATEITGYTPEEHYADPDLGRKIVHPEDLPILEAAAAGQPVSRIRWVRKDGRVVWTESRTHLVVDEEGTPVAVEGIARDVTELKLAEQELEDRARAMARLAEERLALMRRLVRAQEEERQRVALEIHDGIGQVLTSISLFASDLPDTVAEEHRHRAERVRDLIQRAIADSRMLVWSLRPPDLERLGLVPAIHHLVENLRDRGTEHIDVLDETGARRLTPEVETVVFRVVQEALNNAVKYAHASSISVVLAVRGDVFSAVVEDDGRGFDVDAVGASAAGVGLGGMRERADFVGGRLVVESAKGVGTTVRLEVPIP